MLVGGVCRDPCGGVCVCNCGLSEWCVWLVWVERENG